MVMENLPPSLRPAFDFGPLSEERTLPTKHRKRKTRREKIAELDSDRKARHETQESWSTLYKAMVSVYELLKHLTKVVHYYDDCPKEHRHCCTMVHEWALEMENEEIEKVSSARIRMNSYNLMFLYIILVECQSGFLTILLTEHLMAVLLDDRLTNYVFLTF